VETERQGGGENGRVREAVRAGAHLTALSALAFAQPLLDILGKNPEFFAVRGSSAGHIVLFALGLTLVPPALLLGIELLVGLVGRTAAWIVHLVFVAGLVGVIVLHALTKDDVLSGLGSLGVAGLLGVGAAALYARASVVRTYLTFLVAAPAIFVGLFLFQSPVSKLVFPEEANATTVAVGSRTPVVLVVFDEFPTIALMNGAERVDAIRFPNFASLARNATWYRSATTVHPHTEHAVPAILDGRLPKRSQLPIFADHRQ